MGPAILNVSRLGNFRLGYRPAALTLRRRAHITATIAGQPISIRVGSVSIRDVLNDAPNTCSLTINADTPPVSAQRLVILVNNDAPRVLFDGQLETVDETYDGKPTQRAFHCEAQDDTPLANRRIPLGYWEDTSATTVAYWLVETFAPGFTATHVQADLPLITVNFEGSEGGMNGCLRQVAKLIGGYFYWESRDLHLFTEDAEDAPLPLDATPGRFLHDPRIQISRDDTQIRTRVYGKGHGEPTVNDVPAGASMIPLADASMNNPGVGLVISESQILHHTGVQLGGGGALVGPGASPSAGPNLALAGGSGVETGAHDYAVTFVTASGESIAGPRTTISTGLLAAPAVAPNPSSLSSGGAVTAGSHDYAVTFVTLAGGETTPSVFSSAITAGGAAAAPPASAPTAGTPTAGGSVTAGAHYYAVTFSTATGETSAGPNSGSVTTGSVAAPSSAPSGTETAGGSLYTNSGHYWYRVTYITASGETTAGPSFFIILGAFVGQVGAVNLTSIPVSGSGLVTGRRIYRSAVGTDTDSRVVATITNNTVTTYTDGLDETLRGAALPGSNTAVLQTVPLTAIPTGPAGTTARNIYRTAAGGSQLKLLTTIANNTTTTFSDTIADGSLGANVPTGATLNTVNLTGIPLGGPAVTSRNVYRRSGGAGLKLLVAVPDNTSTTYADMTANGSLGGAPPSTNTASVNRVSLSAIATGVAAVTGRKLYRTAVGFSQLKYLATISDNTTTTYTDSTADTGLGADVPATDTSLLAQPAGQVNAGSTTLIVASPAAFAATGGWAIIGNGQQAIRYTGISGQSLTGIPSSGIGSILATVAYNATATAAPALTGVTGLVRPLIKGAPVNIWVQRDDLAAQVALASRDGSDGVIEHRIVDERRGEASLIALCDADLAQFSRPIVTVTYATYDQKTKSGKPITIDLASPAIDETLTIQDVTITELGVSPILGPKFTVSASSVRFSVEDLLRRMAATLEGA